jgi:tryptophan-rich sensory protein
MNNLNRWLLLAFWILLCFAVAGISGSSTAREVTGWYRTLVRPSFAPPNWVFAPVWTLLYAMMAVAAWRVSIAPASPVRNWAIALFLAQLALNFAWSWLFFAHHQLGLALAEVLLLWLAILACVVVFRRLSPLASALMVPYLAWVSFASLLNWGFWRLNR